MSIAEINRIQLNQEVKMKSKVRKMNWVEALQKLFTEINVLFKLEEDEKA
ncbi:hypothetical protein V1498_02620 [Peribacillus sp. SCS-26]